jgi:hypothetical protein
MLVIWMAIRYHWREEVQAEEMPHSLIGAFSASIVLTVETSHTLVFFSHSSDVLDVDRQIVAVQFMPAPLLKQSPTNRGDKAQHKQARRRLLVHPVPST